MNRMTPLHFLILTAMSSIISAERDWNIDVRSTCEQRDSFHGVCLSWKTTGQIEKDKCFLGSSIVQIQTNVNKRPVNDEISIEDLKVGDMVFGRLADGSDGFVKVLDWLHRDPRGHALVYEITTESGDTLTISEDHTVWTEFSYKEARDIRIGDLLAHPNGKVSQVTSIKKNYEEGMYNPLVDGNGTIYANNILSHTLTHTSRYNLPTDLTWTVTKQMAQMMSTGEPIPEDKEYRNGFVNWISWIAGHRDQKETVVEVGYSLEKTDDAKYGSLVIHSLKAPGLDDDKVKELLPKFVQNHQKIRDRNEEFNKELLQTTRTIRSLDQDLEDQTRASQDGPRIVRRSSSRNRDRDNDNDSDNSDDDDDDTARVILFALVSHWSHTIFDTFPVNQTIFR